MRILSMESLAHLPDLRELAARLVKQVPVTTMVYPTIRIGDWEISYDPDGVSYQDGRPLPWRADQPSRFYQCDTLPRLIKALKDDD